MGRCWLLWRAPLMRSERWGSLMARVWRVVKVAPIPLQTRVPLAWPLSRLSHQEDQER
jgi:hypothetical protein